MVHERVEIRKWTGLYPLEQLREEAVCFVEQRRAESPNNYPDAAAVANHVKLMSPGGEIVTSPFHIAVVEQLRAEAFSGSRFSKVPTDVFVFAKGEPQNRAVTKVGGLPFWPRSRAWPKGESKQPLSFVAQVCFADSKDLVGDLPGDVMLIFADGIYGEDWSDEDSEALRFEWVRTTETDLIRQSEIPKARWQLLPCYGAIHRTLDFVDAYESVVDRYNQPYCVDVIEGTKIGGLPRWIQEEAELPGRFLCALGSIQPESKRPYPFINVEQPFDYWSAERRKERDLFLMWGDVGSLYVFLEDDGTIHWAIQGY